MSKDNLEKFDEDFVNYLLKSRENNLLEFKQKVTSKSKIAKSLASLANTQGGILVVGISDQKKIIGIDPNEEMYMLDSANETYCIPKVSYTIETILWHDPNPSPYETEEKTILKVTILKSEQPIRVLSKDGTEKIYIREGDQTRLLI
ncbi:AlbA family DNA-binding domain-containing protein [Algoriphagus vanfongensis]|uniref:AlbA family DNA-binding domain-containing protein n=1 Tax=Algoriphagus vanfongensis TaxID=426371 RepID=UPI000409CB15|nr:ATP-binding protein [Algoriphagus vanfongensis]